MLGSLAAVPLPPLLQAPALSARGAADPVHEALFERFHIDVPVFPFMGMRLLRVSAQVYNRLEQYEQLADALDGLSENASQARPPNLRG